MKPTKCVICKKPIAGYGCNPWPLSSTGQCCGLCDKRTVVPARLAIRGIILTPEQINEMIAAEQRLQHQAAQMLNGEEA